MLKMGDKIRLTSQEVKNFDNLTGEGKAPTNVAEHNEILENAAQAWEQEGAANDMDAEGKLLALLCRDAKIDADKA